MQTQQALLSEIARFFPELVERSPREPPPVAAPTPTLAEAVAYCGRLTRTRYENFVVDSIFLPRRLRTPFRVVYAYCRRADDLADELDDPTLSLAALDRWEAELNAAFARARTGASVAESSKDASPTPIHPIFVALTDVFRRFPGLAREPFVDLLQAFRVDQTRRTWATFADLEDYCRYSANPVGRVVLGLFLDAPTASQLAYSDAICSGLQLANFWQDVARDAAIGRNYVPTDVRARNDGDFRATLRELVAATRAKFAFGRPLLATLSFRPRVVVSLFLNAGVAVLDAIERDGFRVDVRRPTISKARKLLILARSIFSETIEFFRSRGARDGGDR